jgi:hypothetical protein
MDNLGHDSHADPIARARELAAVATVAAVRERFPGWNDDTAAYAEAFATARYLLTDLAGLAERLGGAAADLAEIRALLAAFDWEHDDRQYALERIGMIAEGGQS